MSLFQVSFDWQSSTTLVLISDRETPVQGGNDIDMILKSNLKDAQFSYETSKVKQAENSFICIEGLHSWLD